MTNSNKSKQSDYVSELRSLVEDIEAHEGEWYKEAGGEESRPGVMELPYIASDPLANRAMRFLYDNNLIIDFDWSSWDEGRQFFQKDDPKKFNNLDREYVLKLLTAVARNSRFSDGAWAQLFESGAAQKLFKRLLEVEEFA